MNLLCLIFPISKSCIHQARSYLTLCCGNFILLLLLSAYSFILTWRTVLCPSIEKFLKDKNGIITDQENSESHLWCTEDRDLIHDQCYCPAQPYSLLWDKQKGEKVVWDTHLRGATPQCLEILKLTRTQTPSKTDKKKKNYQAWYSNTQNIYNFSSTTNYLRMSRSPSLFFLTGWGALRRWLRTVCLDRWGSPRIGGAVMRVSATGERRGWGLEHLQ